ncbi:MAG: DUF488 domain-containing protein [Candidatus Heimdallarchaeota archaeon]|nr:DUF488 domain-containing protein [Candidatus Heimdallarchaeota archaeon]
MEHPFVTAKTVLDKELNNQGSSEKNIVYSSNKQSLYTVCGTGYEGENIKQFLKKLENNKIQQLVDIREIPNSRKPGFSKNRLIAALTSLGIEYIHFKLLGSPKVIRHALRENKDYESFFEKYNEYLENQVETMKILEELILHGKTVLLCFEKDHNKCHRKSVLSKLKEAGYGIEDI